MKAQLRKTLSTQGYRTNPVPNKPEHYDIYDCKTSQLVASGTEREIWQWLAGYEETKP